MPVEYRAGSVGWALPIDPAVRGIHKGDITELGNIVAGAFAHPDEAGNGEYLPLVGDFMSFNEIVDALNRQGHKFSFKQLPKQVVDMGQYNSPKEATMIYSTATVPVNPAGEPPLTGEQTALKRI